MSARYTPEVAMVVRLHWRGATHPPTGRPGEVTRMSMAAIAALAFAALVGVIVGIVLPHAAPVAAAPSPSTKYYIVGQPVNGQREYLYDIARKTLGNGKRYQEIVKLNLGRREPDGQVMNDPLDVQPGWILVLPPDANGPGVMTGPPPRIATAAPTATVPATDASAGIWRSVDDNLLRIGGFAVVILLLALAVRVVTGGRRAAGVARRAAVADDEGDAVANSAPGRAIARRVELPAIEPSHRTRLSVTMGGRPGIDLTGHPTATREVAARVAVGGPPAAVALGPAPGVEVPARKPAVSTSEAEPDAGASEAEPGAGTSGAAPAAEAPEVPPDSMGPDAGAPEPVAAPAPAQAPDAVVPGTVASGAVAPRGVAPGDDRPMRTDEPRPALPTDPYAVYLHEELDTDTEPLSLRIVGVAAGRDVPAFAWLADGEEPPPATVPLVVGRRGRWRLLVDLARTPDIVTIVGSEEDCRRRAAGFARQLRESGLGVAVVNGALGDEVVPGVRALDRFPDLPDVTDSRPEPHVVISAGRPGAAARHLVAVTDGRVVPVIIGDLPPGRWSIQVGTVPDRDDGESGAR